MNRQIFKQIYEMLKDDIEHSTVNINDGEDVRVLATKHDVMNICWSMARDLIVAEEKQEENI